MTENIEELFPFESFRPHQREVLEESIESFEEGKDVVVVEAPTGVGKSPLNVALCRKYSPAFYTSPQRKLVRQVASDFGPDKLAIDGGRSDIMPLLGRSAYKCRETHRPCDECPVRDREDESCSSKEGCTYFKQKRATISAQTALITFAMLVTDSQIRGKVPPEHTFEDRELIVLDEVHSLEGQTASMFCGVKISPYNLPDEIWEEAYKRMPSGDIDDYLSWLAKVRRLCGEYVKLKKGDEKERDKCRSISRKVKYMFDEIDEGRDWIVNEGEVEYGGDTVERPEFKPIKVDLFLKRMVWSRADKFVLSSATIPFRDEPQRWLERIGLEDASYSFISAPMSFPVENRPIITGMMGGAMTRDVEDDNWAYNLDKVRQILDKHKGERGIIHTQSYNRAKRLYDDLKGERKRRAYLHNGNDDGDIIEAWIDSGKDVLLSPAIKEGVDLKDDLCRFNILLKCPYQDVGDNRVSFLLDKGEWEWYWNEAMKDTVQSYGRAVRSGEDYAKFYVVDASFEDMRSRTEFPDWFRRAIRR